MKLTSQELALCAAIIGACCDEYGLDPRLMSSPNRGMEMISDCRLLAMYLCAKHSGAKQELIADLFRRHRTAVRHAVKVIPGRVACWNNGLSMPFMKIENRIIALRGLKA